MPAFLARSALSAARAVPALRTNVSRSFATSTVSQKSVTDIVKDVYIKETKGYKPPPAVKDAHKGQVREFHVPPPPAAPAVPSGQELAQELQAYDAQEPLLAESDVLKAGADASGITEPAEDLSAYLRSAEADEPAHAAH